MNAPEVHRTFTHPFTELTTPPLESRGNHRKPAPPPAEVVVMTVGSQEHTSFGGLSILRPKKIPNLVNVDGLTGLSNRRYMDQVLRNEMSRSIRQVEPLTVILADVDLFKAYNDHYGHVAGDDCLKKIGQVLSTSVRRGGDVVARYGGEEFAMILPGTPPEGAMRVAETVRNKVEKLKIPHATSSVARVCTLSAGVYTCLPQQSEKIDTLLQKADACLYQSKINGRNRVTAECCDLIAMKNQLVGSRN